MEDNSKKNELDVCIEDIRSCWKVPAIAHFCSLFRGTFLLPDFEIEELEEALFLDAGVEQSDFLTNLVVQLLRGIHGRKSISCDDYLKWLRSVMKERWELTEKRVNPLNSQDVTFKMLPTLTKVEILHALCDYRLDAADVSVLKDYDGDNLRVEPLGTDRTGATYWYFYGTRLYKEDRQLTQEEREAKHKQKLKEKRRRKKERLKTIKKMKEARKKQKQKDKGKKGRIKAGCKEKKKKKKFSKTSDEEGLSELITTQGLQTSSVTSSKNTKKELRKKNAKSLIKTTPSSKIQKLKDSCNKKIESSEVMNSSKKKNEVKSKRTNSKKQVEKKSTSGKKRQTQTVTSTDRRKCKTVLSKKKKTAESCATTATKNQIKMSKSATNAETKCRNKVSKGVEHDEGASKSRKRKVIKSKAIISESDEDSDEDQPLKKLAKNKMSQKGGSKATSNKQKSDKTRTGNQHQSNKTQSKRTSSSRSKANSRMDDKLPDTKKEKNQKNTEEMSKWSSEEDMSSAVSFPDSSESDSDSEDDVEPPRWHLVCHTQEDWQRLTDTFKKSKVKCEKELYKTLANDFLPEIHSLFAAKEKALRKKLQELAPRRASSRVVIMQLKREEEERLKSIEEAEQSSRRQQVEEEKREKMKLRSKQPTKKEESKDTEPSKAKGSSTSNQEKSKKSNKVKAKVRSKSIYACLQQVYDAVSSHEDSWPFVDPVDEVYAPAYYQIIIKPMCMSIIQKKLNKKEYKTKEEFERDMNQLFTNCLEYNGPGNEYTLMAENLKSCLEYNMEQVFPKQDEEKDSDSDCSSTESDHYVHQRPPQRQSARNANTRLEKMEDKVYARLRGLSSNESSITESRDSSRVDSGDDNETEMDQSENEEASHDEENESGQDDHGNTFTQEDQNQDLKITTRDNDPLVSPRSTSPQDLASNESSLTEAAPSEEQIDMKICDQTEIQPASHSPSRNDVQNVSCASKGVIAFARGSELREAQSDDDTSNQECDQNNTGIKEESTHSNKDNVSGQACVTQVGCKEEPAGHHVTSAAQGTSGSRVNRVKPIQNVRPYIPDSHSKEEDDTSLCAPRERTHQASQGLPAMIDLNSRRPDVLKPLMPSSSDGNATSYKQNCHAVGLDLNKAVPQGNIYTTSSLDLDFQHSKQSEHSGTKSKQQQRKSKSKNLPELPPPLTVPPVLQSAHQHVPSIQPLLSSSNSLQASHWHQQPSTAVRGGAVQQPAHNPPSSSKESGDNSLSEPAQKLWHPLGSEDKFMSTYAKSSPAFYPHEGRSPEKLYPEQSKESQTSRNEMPQASTQSGNILQSLLHKKQSNVSESHQPRSDCKSPYHGPEVAPVHTANDKQSNSITQHHSLSSKSSEHSKLPPSDICFSEAHGQQQSDKEKHQYLSRGYDYGKNMTQSEMNAKISVPTASSHTQQESAKLHQQAVESTVSKSIQSIERHPSNAIQDMETFVAKQEKLVSASHFSQAYSFQSNVGNQMEYGKDSRHTDSGRVKDSALSGRNSGSYLSMLASDSRDVKDYKERLGVEGLTRPQTAYSQAHSSLYTEQLRMRASQASAASYGYSSGSNLSHLLPPRQTPVGQSNSAFTPHDPYSSQSAFRTQRPSPAIYSQYVSPQEAEHLTRQQYQHVHHRSGMGSGLVPYHARPAHAHPDIAYYTQHGISGPLLGNQGVGSVRPRVPYDPSLLSHPSHMQGYK